MVNQRGSSWREGEVVLKRTGGVEYLVVISTKGVDVEWQARVSRLAVRVMRISTLRPHVFKAVVVQSGIAIGIGRNHDAVHSRNLW